MGDGFAIEFVPIGELSPIELLSSMAERLAPAGPARPVVRRLRGALAGLGFGLRSGAHVTVFFTHPETDASGRTTWCLMCWKTARGALWRWLHPPRPGAPAAMSDVRDAVCNVLAADRRLRDLRWKSTDERIFE